MALESATYINGLVATNPTSSDNVSDGDNHIRLIKSAVKATFPNLTGAVTATHTDIDSAVGIVNAATHANTGSAVVRRDSSGNFVAGTITAALAGNVTGDLTGNVTGDVTGNASTASSWATSRTITLTGDATGSVSIDGSADASLTVVVGDDSHNHIISNVDGLQTALDGKASLTGSYSNPSWITSLAGSKVTGNISGNAANVTGTVPLTNGGTGATTAAAALAALGGLSGVLNSSNSTSLSISIEIGGVDYILQAGSGFIGGNTTGSVSFPTPYTTYAFCVVSGGPTSASYEGDVHSYYNTTTGASIVNSASATASYRWIALGY